MPVREFFFRREKWRKEEEEKIRRLESVEAEVEDLSRRANRAISALSERQSRNHWREAIQQIIREGHAT